MGLHKAIKARLVLQKVNKSDKDGYIYLRVVIPQAKRYILKSLNHKIPANCWDKVNEIVKKPYREADRVNKLIKTDKEALQDILDREYKAGTIFTEIALRNLMFAEKKDNNFLTFYRSYIDNLIATKKKAKGTIAIWETEYEQLKTFRGENIPFKAITTDWLNDYHKSLTKYQPTTIFKKLKKLRQIILLAIKQEHIHPKQVAGFEMVKYVQPDTNYLTLQQVNKIADKVYKGEYDYDKSLKITACFFLVECFGGIRISDYRNFEIEKLVKDRNFKVRTKKNKEHVYLDLGVFTSLDKIVSYIAKERLIFDITDQTANDLLKQIGRDIKLKFALSSHDGRRTFATLLGELSYSTRFIADAMGVTERTASGYIKITKQGMSNEQHLRGGF